MGAPAAGLQEAAVGHRVGEAKIRQFDVTLGVDEKVLRLLFFEMLVTQGVVSGVGCLAQNVCV